MKLCKACAQEIPAAATLCYRCSTHQNWRWDLVLKLGLGTLLTLIAAPVVSGLVALGKDVYSRLTWDDKIQVIGFYSDTGYTLRNAGDGPLFVTHIRTIWDSREDTTIPVSKIVEPGHFLSMARQVGGEWIVVRNIAPDDSRGIAALNLSRECLRFTYAFTGDPALEIYKERLVGLKTLPAKGTVRFHSPRRTQPVDQPFPVEVFLTRRVSPDCQPKPTP